MDIDGAVVFGAVLVHRRAEAKRLDASILRRLWGFLAQAFQPGIGEGAPNVGMVGKHNRDSRATTQSRAQFADIALHFGAIGACERNIQAEKGMEPEVLVLQVDKLLCIGKRLCIQLRDALKAGIGVETVGVFRDGTRDLYKGLAFNRFRQWMLWRE